MAFLRGLSFSFDRLQHAGLERSAPSLRAALRASLTRSGRFASFVAATATRGSLLFGTVIGALLVRSKRSLPPRARATALGLLARSDATFAPSLCSFRSLDLCPPLARDCFFDKATSLRCMVQSTESQRCSHQCRKCKKNMLACVIFQSKSKSKFGTPLAHLLIKRLYYTL